MNSRLLLTALYLALLAPFAHAQNVAEGKPITSSGAIWPGMTVNSVNDGNVATFAHPLAGAGTLGFHYQVDLGQEYALHHISVVNRGDGCCPERLTNYQLTLYADAGGSPGAVLWQANIRTDGSNSGIGGTDIAYASASTNPAHQFRGRFLRLTNLSGGAYDPQAAELQAWVVSANHNIAQGRPVVASGATWPGLPATNITDGQRSSLTHPDTGATLGYYYQTDLGAEYALNRIVLYNRDNCCPERLTNYRVTVYADSSGSPGAALWSADIRTDGSNSGIGGADTLLATTSANPAHQFRGRFIRVTNLSGGEYNPQIAELEVFAEPPPTIRYFLTTAGNIGGAGLPASATLSWQVENATSVSISGVGTVAASGSVTVAPGTGTTYTLTAVRAGIATVIANVVIAVNASQQLPRINEFQAADGIVEDEDGDRPDWIELYNPNAYTLNIAGLRLTDDPALPAKWIAPLANIPPGGYALVFASAKNRAIVGSPLHTNFSLAAAGEYLALSSSAGALIQQFPADYPTTLTFPAQFDRVSYGITTGGAKYMKPVTPGGPNGTGLDGVVADTVFSIKRGIFTTPQSVTISTLTPGATIRYTTNGTEPTETSGTIYTGPIGISTTTVLRAAAFKTAFAPTNVDTNTYLFPAAVVASGVMSPVITTDPAYAPHMQAALTDLPSISVVTPAVIAQENPVPCSFEYIPATGVGVQENAGVELFGGEFSAFQKQAFRVSFSATFGASKITIPGLFSNHARGWKPTEKFDQLELRGGSHDMLQRGFSMSNIFTDGTMFDLGAFSVHSRFVHLYRNGTYWGVYQLRERWNAAHHTAYFGGPSSDHESINGNYNVGGWAQPGDAYDGDGTSWERIKSLRADYAGVAPYLDTTQFVDYMVMWLFGNAEDEYRTTGPKNAGSGFKFFLNDADGYLGGWNGNPDTTFFTNPPPGRLGADGPGSLLSGLFVAGNSDFRMLLADRIHRALFGNGALTPAANAARLSAMCAEINRAYYAEAARWYTSGEQRTPSSWATERDTVLNTWLPTRTAVMLARFQANGFYPSLTAPAFTGGAVASGTIVNFPVAGATVYFTTDGTDPRLPGGAVNPAATLATSKTMTANTWLRARAKSGATWSALNEAFYTVTAPLVPGDVVISEIHYNPLGDDDAEFIELLNPTTRAINLRGAKFTAGLNYDFPDNRDVPLAPGGRLVLCANLYAFQQRYGLNVPVFAVYFDRLGNDGDTLTLTTAAATQLTSLQYQDLAPWPDSADGDGYSLVLTNPAAPTAPASWRTSTAAGGNPASTDSTTFAGTALADADADTIPALLEHFFTTNDTAPNASPITAGRTVDGRLTITFPRRLTADDLTLTVEVSTDLATWQPLISRTSHINHGNGTATETWTADAASNAQFARLRVVK